ncbi:MAG TPA: cell envelope integrity protein TolA [Burkholderiaceae bacterium]|jgi:colicin import membrane protein|nr:cell envelope integrity protein TolA [Burkholderiaceae bacterium]HPL80575.1 cell envelope integrity protein TolA [Burkholderiaceae bacterium]
MPATADWAEFAPPQPPAQLRALGLALLVHVLLLGALGWGVSWRQQADRTLTVEAELWSAVPRQAAPRLQAQPPAPPPPEPAPVPRPAPPPPPPPEAVQRDADIALARQKKEAEALAAQQKLEQEQKRRQKLEAEKKEALLREQEKKRLAQEKAEQERQKKAVDERKAKEKQLALEAQKKEEAARTDKELKAQREANLRRIAGLAGATGAESSKGSAERASGPSASYGGKVAARVKPNIVFPDEIAGNPLADVEVRAAPDGTILGARLLKSSGVKAWDEAVLKAIAKTEKLPLDTDGRAPSTLIIGFRPKD